MIKPRSRATRAVCANACDLARAFRKQEKQRDMEDQVVQDARLDDEEEIDYHMVDELQQHNIK